MKTLRLRTWEIWPRRACLAETLAALTSLGYSEQEVLPVAESHLAGCTTVEQLLKETLKALGSGR